MFKIKTEKLPTAPVCVVARLSMCIEGTLSSEFGGNNIHMSYSHTILMSCSITINVSYTQAGEWNDIILVNYNGIICVRWNDIIHVGCSDIIPMKWNVIHEFE